MTVAQLRDEVLADHREDPASELCAWDDEPWPCAPYRLATALSPEAVAPFLHAEWDRRTNELSEPGVPCEDCLDSAAALLGAIPVDTQEDQEGDAALAIAPDFTDYDDD